MIQKKHYACKHSDHRHSRKRGSILIKRNDTARIRKTQALFYLLVSIAALAIGYLSLGKNFDFSVYHSFQGDGTLLSAMIKSIQEHGIAGIWFNSRIGAPEISALVDFPAMDLLMASMIWIISLFTSSTSAIAYVYLMITFLLDALSMSLLLRKMGINDTTVFVISILFSAAPFHFFRYLSHAVLSNYMSFAITIYLSFCILDIFDMAKNKWKICFCCILLGFGYGYYYAFGLIVLSMAYVIKFVNLNHKKEIFRKLWIFAFVLATILISLIPKIGYGVLYGTNPIVGKRSFVEQETYGLKIIQMLLPPSYSRFSALRELNLEYSQKAPYVNENALASLGMIASAGFLLLCVMLICSFASRKKREGNERLVIDFLSLSTLTLILMGSIGGFGEIFNYLVTAQIRCYNRSSIYIAGTSLLLLAILLHKAYEKKKQISYMISGIIFLIGLVDQVNIHPNHWQEDTKNKQLTYEKFFENVEERLSDGAMVYQLPYLDFPEVSSSYDYKHLIGYLFTDTLKWSYGGVKGRNEAAGNLNLDNGMSNRFLAEIQAAGFEAVYIDLDGYEDGGSRVMQFYDNIGVEPIVSDDGKLYLFDLSNMKISVEKFITGYSFVNFWANNYQMNIRQKEKIAIAKGIGIQNRDAYLKLYEAVSDSDVIKDCSDVEYIDFLYETILRRKEIEEERNLWLEYLQKGGSREDVFCSFLDSEEFRIGNGYQNIQ